MMTFFSWCAQLTSDSNMRDYGILRTRCRKRRVLVHRWNNSTWLVLRLGRAAVLMQITVYVHRECHTDETCLKVDSALGYARDKFESAGVQVSHTGYRGSHPYIILSESMLPLKNKHTATD